MKYYNKKSENILNDYNRGDFSFKDINCCQEYGYYPTFVVIYDNVDYSSIPHYHCCYIAYDKDKNIKYFLWGDDIKDSFRVMSADKSLERLKKYQKFGLNTRAATLLKNFTHHLMIKIALLKTNNRFIKLSSYFFRLCRRLLFLFLAAPLQRLYVAKFF